MKGHFKHWTQSFWVEQVLFSYMTSLNTLILPWFGKYSQISLWLYPTKAAELSVHIICIWAWLWREPKLKLTQHATLCVRMFCANVHIWAEESRTCVHVFTSVGKLLQQHPEALHYRWGNIVGVNLLHRNRVTPPKHAICQHINRHFQQRL